jgi:hypothetical protein
MRGIVSNAIPSVSNNTEEAKPYQFERDEIIPEFDEFTQMLVPTQNVQREGRQMKTLHIHNAFYLR